jgi:hypothetical protein
MTRLAIFATILTVASGCDKARELAGGGAPAQAAEPTVPQLNLASKPDILFKVFGERDDPRMIPVAAIQNGQLSQIGLTAAGWRQFDGLYTRSGASYNLYRDGRAVGSVQVRQGMWEKPGQPLYSLPRCELLTPLAAVTIDPGLTKSFTVEFLASNAELGGAPVGRPLSPAQTEQAARALAAAVGSSAGISAAEMQRLDFRALTIATGASTSPTVIASMVDPNAEGQVESGGSTMHLFAIADMDAEGRYHPSFDHTVNGPASAAEYRRYLDHLDVNGDGVDEIVLEGWQYGGDTFLQVLGFKAGRWVEVYRARSSWCLDAKSE